MQPTACGIGTRPKSIRTKGLKERGDRSRLESGAGEPRPPLKPSFGHETPSLLYLLRTSKRFFLQVFGDKPFELSGDNPVGMRSPVRGQDPVAFGHCR